MLKVLLKSIKKSFNILLIEIIIYFINYNTLAYNSGSIIKGHLIEYFKIIALSIEKGSFGNFYYWIQLPIVIKSLNSTLKLKSSSKDNFFYII